MPAIRTSRIIIVPADESPDPMFWQGMADSAASYARIAYINGDYNYSLRVQEHAARYAATARKEYKRWCKRL